MGKHIAQTWFCQNRVFEAGPHQRKSDPWFCQQGPQQTHSAVEEIEFADQDEDNAPGPRSLGTQTSPADYIVPVESDEPDLPAFTGGLFAFPDTGLGR